MRRALPCLVIATLLGCAGSPPTVARSGPFPVFQGEIERLEDLREINDHVRPEEIAAVRQQKTDLQSALASARLRLDALRLIWRMP